MERERQRERQREKEREREVVISYEKISGEKYSKNRY